MGINSNQPHKWKSDIAKSVDMYNEWFMTFAPIAFRSTRIKTTADVENALIITENLTIIDHNVLTKNPEILPTLRMSTCPPLAVDRLIGLSKTSSTLVKKMENEHKIPERMTKPSLKKELIKIGTIIQKMADPDIFVWLSQNTQPTEIEFHRAATIVADRLCGAVANPIIRNAQEKRQLEAIKKWLEKHGYKHVANNTANKFTDMQPGTFSFRLNVAVKIGKQNYNIPIDAVIMPKKSGKGQYPLLIEAKSAGDFTNVNKRRKEEASKMIQLKTTYGKNIKFILFLCGYFDSGYLGYEAAEGIDWIWEHSIDDLEKLGL